MYNSVIYSIHYHHETEYSFTSDNSHVNASIDAAAEIFQFMKKVNQPLTTLTTIMIIYKNGTFPSWMRTMPISKDVLHEIVSEPIECLI